jgi:hypothetical protein
MYFVFDYCCSSVAVALFTSFAFVVYYGLHLSMSLHEQAYLADTDQTERKHVPTMGGDPCFYAVGISRVFARLALIESSVQEYLNFTEFESSSTYLLVGAVLNSWQFACAFLCGWGCLCFLVLVRNYVRMRVAQAQALAAQERDLRAQERDLRARAELRQLRVDRSLEEARRKVDDEDRHHELELQLALYSGELAQSKQELAGALHSLASQQQELFRGNEQQNRLTLHNQCTIARMFGELHPGAEEPRPRGHHRDRESLGILASNVGWNEAHGGDGEEDEEEDEDYSDQGYEEEEQPEEQGEDEEEDEDYEEDEQEGAAAHQEEVDEGDQGENQDPNNPPDEFSSRLKRGGVSMVRGKHGRPPMPATAGTQ